MVHNDTIELLKECNSGVKMGVSAIDEVIDHVEDSRLEIEELYSINGKLYAGMRNAGGYKSWLPGILNEKGMIYGKLVDEDNDGMYEFIPFEWDGSEIGYDLM